MVAPIYFMFLLIFMCSKYAQSICMMILHRHSMCDIVFQSNSRKSWDELKLGLKKIEIFWIFRENQWKPMEINRKPIETQCKSMEISENQWKSRFFSELISIHHNFFVNHFEKTCRTSYVDAKFPCGSIWHT